MASKTIRELEAKLNEKQAQLDLLLRDVESLRHVLVMMSADEDEQPEEEVPAAKAIRNSMVQILADRGEPMHYGEIFEQLIANGVNVPGKDPRRNVGAHLSIDDRFSKQGSGYWALASWVNPSPRIRLLFDGDLLDDPDTEPTDSRDDEIEQSEPDDDDLRRIARENFISIPDGWDEDGNLVSVSTVLRPGSPMDLRMKASGGT